ncbi:amino acid ABC transporter ATP-binding protein [Cellulomonas phragmiteti]|uniref:L-cystine import ATP-binding protein TcyC n=1 Tax=Cellulomonas phragmiteti TaxID=478780 RepID=A0ABQ4DMI4_9CELL|nr:amino acid ABC transporter ATP-binding protein [Cellulomonas phragmiteti]GIG40131.1 L-cystine import ATP-binding protein TcyC [Cellulomonas phragmiteti]
MTSDATTGDATSPDAGRPLVEVHGLTKSFGDLHVLRGIDLSVDRGSVTVLIGPSGSGKTTLLRCLNSLEVPEAGTVRVDDVELDLARRPTRGELKRLRATSGMVFQSHQLFPHRTALQNVTEGPVFAQRRPVAQATAEATALLAKVGLADKADAYPHELSGGQQQRVGIARALALRPRLLLFDEPTSALDPETVGEVLAVMRDLAAEGWTMVVVTHEIRFARQVADHVVFMDDGVVVEEGRPDDVLGDPRQERTRRFLQRILDPL